MRRFALLLLAGASSLVAALPAQGFGVYEQNTCTMARAGVAAARPCADGSAIFFNPAGLAGLGGNRLSVGTTLIAAQGGFTDDVTATKSDLKNPVIPVPSVYFTHQINPKFTAGIGLYVPYGLETKWDTANFPGRFLGYNTDVRSFYIQPTVGYELTPRLKVGLGIAYIASRLTLKQRLDLSSQLVPPALAALFPAPGLPPGTTFGMLGVPTRTEFADADLHATGSGFAVNFGGILKITDRLSIGGHWITRKTIKYSGTASFLPESTHLAVPATIGTCPACVPAGTPLDGLLAGEFATGGPLSSQGVATSIVMPSQGSLGFAYKMQDNWTVMADYQYTVWGWFNQVKIDFENPATPDLTLNPQNKDTHGFRFGTEYQYSPKVQIRGGYLYHTGASPSSFVTPLLPEGPRNEFTIGAGLELTPKLHGDLAYQYIKQNDRRGTVNIAAGNTGLYQFSAHLFGLGLAYTF
jgi:long-chain fatty acid transport protein